jgi:hypothetical protein
MDVGLKALLSGDRINKVLSTDYESRLIWAHAILAERGRWCELALSLSRRVRFLNWVSNQPFIWRWGRTVQAMYDAKHPDKINDVADAYLICLAAPINPSRRPTDSALK